MSLPMLRMRTIEEIEGPFSTLPSSIVHWKLVELLFEERQMQKACRTLIKWAATHHGATEDAQHVLNGTDVDGIEGSERRLEFREWYWRRAFQLFFLANFNEILNGRELPLSPLVGASWESEFKQLCKELNPFLPNENPTILRFQRVRWSQRELDKWWEYCTTGSRQYPSLAAVLEFVGARTQPHTMRDFWGSKDARLTFLMQLLEADDLTREGYSTAVAEIRQLQSEGAQLVV